MSLEVNPNIKIGQTGYTAPAVRAEKAHEVEAAPIALGGTNTTTRKDLSNMDDISNRAKMNSPVAQGLASAKKIESGKLVSGYHFDGLEAHDAKLFALKYNSANAPQIARETEKACTGIEAAGVEGNIQSAAAKGNPFAKAFV